MAATSTQPHRSFLALGDSYTIGEGVGLVQRWPAQLVARLREQSTEIDAAEIVATTGWTTDELQQAIDARDFKPPYALVTLMIGVNNQYRGRELANYTDEFDTLLEFAVSMAGSDAGRVIVVSIPDWGTTRFAASQQVDAGMVAVEIDHFNEVARSASAARGAHWLDVTALSRGEAREMLADDGLHPSAEQYALWVDVILPVARSILRAAD